MNGKKEGWMGGRKVEEWKVVGNMEGRMDKKMGTKEISEEEKGMKRRRKYGWMDG